MRVVVGDIWSLASTHAIAVGTNVGWDERADPPCRANMGEGLAAQARDRFPRLAWWYGLTCLRWRLEQTDPVVHMPPCKYRDPFTGVRLVLVPVKPLAADPAMSWDQPASIEMVRAGVEWISLNTEGQVAVPLLGTGNGRLDRSLVRTAIAETLVADRFVLVEPGDGC